MQHLNPKALETFNHRQAKSIKEMRYLGIAQDYDENDKPIRAVKGLTNRSASLQRICENAMAQFTFVGSNMVKVWNDPLLNDATKVVRTAALAKASIGKIKAECDSNMMDALSEYESMAAKMAKTWEPPASAGQAAIDGELRALLRGMNDNERLAAVRKDPALMAAAARAPAVLSGLAGDVHKTIRHEYAAKIDPDLVAQADDLKAAIFAAENALQALNEDLGSLTDMESAQTLESKSSASLMA